MGFRRRPFAGLDATYRPARRRARPPSRAEARRARPRVDLVELVAVGTRHDDSACTASFWLERRGWRLAGLFEDGRFGHRDRSPDLSVAAAGMWWAVGGRGRTSAGPRPRRSTPTTHGHASPPAPARAGAREAPAPPSAPHFATPRHPPPGGPRPPSFRVVRPLDPARRPSRVWRSTGLEGPRSLDVTCDGRPATIASSSGATPAHRSSAKQLPGRHVPRTHVQPRPTQIRNAVRRARRLSPAGRYGVVPLHPPVGRRGGRTYLRRTFSVKAARLRASLLRRRPGLSAAGSVAARGLREQRPGFPILGPGRSASRRDPTRAGRAQAERAVLALLLLHRGEVVSSRSADGPTCWGEPSRPATARKGRCRVPRLGPAQGARRWRAGDATGNGLPARRHVPHQVDPRPLRESSLDESRRGPTAEGERHRRGPGCLRQAPRALARAPPRSPTWPTSRSPPGEIRASRRAAADRTGRRRLRGPNLGAAA